jgi:DNA-binding transcriptional LysR family regulator
MDIRVLQYFLTVAREQTISGAAEVLHMTQPPLSKQLKELEAELGKQLLIRGKRRITLTKEGMLLRKRAEEIVTLMEKTKSEIITSDEVVSGEVYIGGGETEGMRPIAKTIRRVQEKYPNIRFHLFSGDGYDVTEHLDRGLIDFGTLIEPLDMGKYDSMRLPRPDTWGLIMRKDSPLAQKERIVPEDLKDIPLISSRQLEGEDGLSGWLGYSSEKLNVVATGNLLNNQRLLAEENVGYVLTLDQIVNLSGDSPLCFRPLSPKLESWMYLAWKKYQVFSPAAEVFLRELQNELPEE